MVQELGYLCGRVSKIGTILDLSIGVPICKEYLTMNHRLWHGRHGHFDTDNVKNIGHRHRYIYDKIWNLFIDLLFKKLKILVFIFILKRFGNTCLNILSNMCCMSVRHWFKYCRSKEKKYFFSETCLTFSTFVWLFQQVSYVCHTSVGLRRVSDIATCHLFEVSVLHSIYI
jgi:hypothetical protein